MGEHRYTDRYFRSGTSCCRPNLNSHFHKRCSSSNERCWSLGSCSFGCLYGPLRVTWNIWLQNCISAWLCTPSSAQIVVWYTCMGIASLQSFITISAGVHYDCSLNTILHSLLASSRGQCFSRSRGTSKPFLFSFRSSSSSISSAIVDNGISPRGALIAFSSLRTSTIHPHPDKTSPLPSKGASNFPFKHRYQVTSKFQVGLDSCGATSAVWIDELRRGCS